MVNSPSKPQNYDDIRTEIVSLLKTARSAAARNVNTIITATYWEIGRRIVTLEQSGEQRAEYGEQLIEKLARDLTRQFGRGFGRANLRQMRAFLPPRGLNRKFARRCLANLPRPMIAAK